MEAKISIIIPAYNAATFLPMCLESVLAQSMRELEIIIINDGSTDDTGAICDNYTKIDSRIRAVHKANAGVSEARNTGIAEANGEYFWFVDADDTIAPNSCEELYNLAAAQGADILIFDYTCESDGTTAVTFHSIFSGGTYEDDAVITSLVRHFVGFSNEGIHCWLRGEPDGLYVENPALWRTFIRSNLVNANNLRFDPTLKVGEDTIFISLCLSYAGRAVVTHNVQYYQRLHDASTVARYEKSPESKLTNKLALLTARRVLTDDIAARRAIDIKPFWQGTVVMSYMELCFLFAQTIPDIGNKARYKHFLFYGKDPSVTESLSAYPSSHCFSIRAVPFWLMKRRLHRFLFFCATILNRTGFKFKRE